MNEILKHCRLRFSKPKRVKYRDKNIACFHYGRCGSTVLANMLEQTDHITWDDEVFHKMKVNYRLMPFSRFYSSMKQYFQFRLWSFYVKNYGFEIKFLKDGHLNEHFLNLDEGEFLKLITKNNFCHYILISRKNFLRQLISKERGRIVKKYHYDKEANNPKAVFIDPNSIPYGGKPTFSLVDLFRKFEKNYDLIREYTSTHKVNLLELVYENDIEPDPNIAYQKVCAFLDLKAITTNVSLNKSIKKPIPQLVSNYDEIRSSLEDTKYAWMLND